MRAKTIYIAMLVLVLGLAVAVVCVSANRVKTGAGDMIRLDGANGVVIECDPNMYDLAQRLLPEVEKRVAAEEQQAAQNRAMGDKLKQNYEDIQRFIYSEIGVAEPKQGDPSMFMGSMSDVMINSMVSPVQSIKHLKIYDMEELKSRLSKGEQIDGFSMDPNTGVLVMTHGFMGGATVININGKVTTNEENSGDNATILLINPGDQPSEMKQALANLDSYGNVGNMIALTSVASSIRMSVMTAIQSNYDISPSKRWFYEGMSNYLTSRCLDKFFGQDVAAEYLKPFDAAQYQDLKDQVDLRKWPGGNMQVFGMGSGNVQVSISQMGSGPNGIDLKGLDLKDIPELKGLNLKGLPEGVNQFVGDIRLQQAASAFATSEVMGLAQRHGVNSITDIFTEIGKSEEPTEQTIFSAITTVTGEDFKAILGQYGSKAK